MPEKLDPETYARAYAKAVAFVRRRMRGQPWAESDLPEELAAQAMTSSFDPEGYPWRRDKPLDHHVVLVVKTLLSDRARAAKVRAKPQNAAAADEAAKRSALPADARVRARDREARRDRRSEQILAELEGTEREVFLLYLEHIFDPAQQAQILGKSLPAIYKARHRVIEVARSVEVEPESSPELAPSGDGDDGGEDMTGDDGEAAS